MEVNAETRDEYLNFHENEVPNGSDSNADLKKIIETIKLVIKRSKLLLRKYILLFLLIFVCGIGYAVYSILNKEILYMSSVTFMLGDESANSQNSVIDPLSSYLLTRSISQTINLDKMKGIAMSQKLLSNLLFNKCVIRGKDDFLMNHILIIYYGMDASYFKSYRGLNGLDRNQYRVYQRVASLIAKSTTVEQTTAGLYVLKVSMINEELAKVTSELIYQNLSNFYIDKTTEKAQRNYLFLRNRLDSVRNMLYSSEYQVANFEDRSRNLLLNTARVPQVRQQRNTEFFNAIYAELLRSFENSKVSLNNITPIFQLLNRPYYPLTVVTKSSQIILVINVMISFFLMLLLLIVLYVKNYIWPEYRVLFFSQSDNIEDESNKD